MTNSLTIFTEASRMLAEADTIQKAKELKDLALTAADWAKRKDMGEEAIQYARSYALEAERRMGELLLATERQKPGEYQRSHDVTVAPSLAELGISKRESAQAQKLAVLPVEIFDQVKTNKKTLTEINKNLRQTEINAKRDEVARSAGSIAPSERWNVWQADIRSWKAPRQYDFIITDPPYPKEYLVLWEVLAERANEWLKDGGLLIAMSGQSYLDQIYQMLSKHLKYYWTAAYLTPGQPTPLRQVNVNSTWKPLLIYSKDKYEGKIFGDVCKSDGNDKDFHIWGQSESGMLSIAERFCSPGQYILDPFCGGGTTGVAALEYGCLFDGIDIDIENVNISRGRLNDKTKI